MPWEETVEVVGTKSKESECGKNDEYVERSEYFLFDLLLGRRDINLTK